MTDDTQNQPKGGWWNRLWRRPKSAWLLGIPVGAFLMFVLGAVAVVGSEVAIHATGSEQFCSSACHSMEAFTTPEWQDSIHYFNASGVRATCADCHIPNGYPEKLWVKTRSGIKDMYHELRGTISTREKYEEHRAEMAERVWADMKETDSRECRYCHSAEHFDTREQEEHGARAHQRGLEAGKTCIDCHKGIAHRTPDEIAEEDQVSLAR